MCGPSSSSTRRVVEVKAEIGAIQGTRLEDSVRLAPNFVEASRPIRVGGVVIPGVYHYPQDREDRKKATAIQTQMDTQ
jgi:hypothetical protein